MKYFLWAVLSLVCPTCIIAPLWMSDVYELARECIKRPDVNGTEDDVTDLLMGYLPDSRSGKCMLKCMEEHAGILVNDTFDLRGTYLFFRRTFDENPYYKNMERAVRFCGQIVTRRRTAATDSCQFAHMVAACIKRRIRFRPGCRTAFYEPFKWKSPSRRATIKPGKKYFVPDPRFIEKIQFEIITRPTKKYSLDDLTSKLTSVESIDSQAYVRMPPKLRKGKWGRTKKEELKEKRKKEKKTDGSESESGLDISQEGDDETWEKSSKTRRHKKKFII